MKKLKSSKFYLIGLLAVVALGTLLTFAYATNDNSVADKSDECLNKGEKSELALLKCGEEGEEKKCGEAEGEKKCGEGKCEEAKKKECEGEKKCGEGEEKKCGEAEGDEEGEDAAEEVEDEVETE